MTGIRSGTRLIRSGMGKIRTVVVVRDLPFSLLRSGVIGESQSNSLVRDLREMLKEFSETSVLENRCFW
jgi:hypothetical protein